MHARVIIGTIVATVIAIFVGNWQASLIDQQGSLPVHRVSTCGDGVCEGGESQFGCDPVPEIPSSCDAHIFCPEDCGTHTEPIQCLAVLCASPPEGCKYTQPKIDEHGCQLNCGTVVCIELSPPVLCEGKYKPGESYLAADGCNKCHCSENGVSGCTKKYCPNPSDVQDPDQGCFSSNDCGDGTVCSVDFGDCTPPRGEPSLDVCTGFCMPKEFGYPETLSACDTTDECIDGRICTKDFADDCLASCPLSDSICAVMCNGRCILPEMHDNDHDQMDQHPEDDWKEHEFEDEVRTVEVRSRFQDTDADSLEGIAANTLAQQGVIGGFADKTFRGGQPVNRAEAAKFLLMARFGFVEERRNDNYFLDVLEGEWYVKYVIGAAELGIISGYPNGTFRPANTVNMVEFLKMLSETFDLPQSMNHQYSDVPQGAWFAKYAGTAEAYQLFPGRPRGQLQPDRLLTRGEVAIAIYRLLENW